MLCGFSLPEATNVTNTLRVSFLLRSSSGTTVLKFDNSWPRCRRILQALPWEGKYRGEVISNIRFLKASNLSWDQGSSSAWGTFFRNVLRGLETCAKLDTKQRYVAESKERRQICDFSCVL